MIGKTNSVIQIGTINASGFPIEISDAAELSAELSNDNIGKMYRYTGPMTDTYTQNTLFMVVNDEV